MKLDAQSSLRSPNIHQLQASAARQVRFTHQATVMSNKVRHTRKKHQYR